MFTNILQYLFPSSSDISENDQMQTNISFDTRLDMEYKEFLPEVSDTWSFIQQLSRDTTHFREIYDLYKYERSIDQQRLYFEQLKSFDENIYKLSFIIHQRIQSLEKIIQPTLNDYQKSILNHQQMNNYTPAYVRIAQNQLNSLKSSFKQIITKHNSDSIEYQNNLQQSLEYAQIELDDSSQDNNNLINTDDEQQQIHFSQEQQQLIDLQTRLESIKLLKDRVRQMNEMTMALYLSVQEQNELTDNIWLNTSAGSDYIAQSIDEFHLVKTIKQSKMNLWIKLICIIFSFFLILIFFLTLILIFNQK